MDGTKARADHVNWQDRFLATLETGLAAVRVELSGVDRRLSFLEGRAAATGAVAGIIGGGVVSLTIALLLR